MIKFPRDKSKYSWGSVAEWCEALVSQYRDITNTSMNPAKNPWMFVNVGCMTIVRFAQTLDLLRTIRSLIVNN